MLTFEWPSLATINEHTPPPRLSGAHETLKQQKDLLTMLLEQKFLGFTFSVGPFEAIRSRIRLLAQDPGFAFVVTPNVDHVVTVYNREHPALDEVYQKAGLVLCDSRVLSFAGRTLGVFLSPCPGSDLTASLFTEPMEGLTLGVMGPSASEFDILAARYPEASLTFIPTPKHLQRGSYEWERCLDEVSAAPWDILLICISFPKQEFLALDLKNRGHPNGVGLCVGASVDFLTGKAARAPRMFQKFGLEWAFRLFSNPGRLSRRYLVKGPKIFMILWKAYRTRRS